ncbi:hypothetical protein OEG86_16805 [Hoeflea alexandrii]|uniref:hypothetical protein n=1 Tax=Hoeflea alexandrii TaxID=288436 RepID=UPI00226D7987|nr:hypothetical protein [Hoeflea alexandrii]MCY0153613.1 hypothetical protein [Hoeflea alexandrii]
MIWLETESSTPVISVALLAIDLMSETALTRMPLTLCVVVSSPAWVVLAASIAPREASATV